MIKTKLHLIVNPLVMENMFLNRMSMAHTVISMTGSIYNLHPTLASRLEEHTKRLTKHSFTVQLCEDGSSKGANLVAAIAHRLGKLLNKCICCCFLLFKRWTNNQILRCVDSGQKILWKQAGLSRASLRSYYRTSS